MSEAQLIYINEVVLTEEGFFELEDDFVHPESLIAVLKRLPEIAIRIEDENLIIGTKQLQWLLSQDEPAKVILRFIVEGEEIDVEGTIRLVDFEIQNRAWVPTENDGFWFTRVPSAKG